MLRCLSLVGTATTGVLLSIILFGYASQELDYVRSLFSKTQHVVVEMIDAHQDDVSAYRFVCQVDFSWRTSAWAFSDMRANTPCHTMGSATPSF